MKGKCNKEKTVAAKQELHCGGRARFMGFGEECKVSNSSLVLCPHPIILLLGSRLKKGAFETEWTWCPSRLFIFKVGALQWIEVKAGEGELSHKASFGRLLGAGVCRKTSVFARQHWHQHWVRINRFGSTPNGCCSSKKTGYKVITPKLPLCSALLVSFVLLSTLT